MLFAFLLTSCSARPVLYPNRHLNTVGAAQAKRDIADCRSLADDYVKKNPAGTVVSGTVQGGIGGGAVGAAGGAVLGHAGRGAEVGAVTGAAGGFVRGIFRARQPSATYKNFVNKCLRDKGYETVGWE
ncbi:MAG: cell envelope biogenesis protein OmpA [Proteobacteria bacterium]|nr:cell envelope biogenesis protein OmpA [Pseudomonadota bacterium]